MRIFLLPRALLGFTLLAGGLCLSPQAAPQGESILFPTPPVGMTFEGREGDASMALEELLLEFGERTGEHLVWNDDTRVVMEGVRVAFDRPLVIPAEELYSAIEAILVANRFVLVDLRREEPRMMAVHSLDTPTRAYLRARATFVPGEDLALYEDHPAILITTVVHLPGMEVRTLANAIRAMIVDPNTMQIVPLPGSPQLMLTGCGADIVRLVALLRELNENESEPMGRLEQALLPLAEPPPSLAAVPERLKASEHQRVGALIGKCIEGYVNREGRRDAEAELLKALERKWTRAARGRDPLSLTGDLGAALWYAADYAREEGIEKGKVADLEVTIPYYGTREEPYLARSLLWTPSTYEANGGPYPLLLCIPEVGASPREELNAHWANRELLDEVIVLCLEMPERTENWGRRGNLGDPGGFGILFSAFIEVRDRYAIDFDRVFVAGRGFGVRAAMEIANAAPDRFAGVIGRAGDAAEVSPDNFSNLPCLLAGGGDNAARFAERARELGGVQPVLLPDADGRDILRWIQATRRRSLPEEVVLLAGDPMPNRAYWLEIPPHDGRAVARLKARADRSSNTIDIRAEGISRVTLYLNDVLVDLDRTVRVVVNGVENELTIARDFNTTMEQIYRGRSDPGRVYTAAVTLDTR